MKRNRTPCLSIILLLFLLGFVCLAALLLLGPVVGSTFNNVESNYPGPPHNVSTADDGPGRHYPVEPAPVIVPTPDGGGSDDYDSYGSGGGSGPGGFSLSRLFDSTGIICSGSGSGCGSSSIIRPTRRPPTATPAPSQNGRLRAGELDDNTNWTEYLRYRQNYAGAGVHNREVSERHLIEVKDKQGNPILNATVRVFVEDAGERRRVHTAKTYASGQTLFHPLALGMPRQQPEEFTVEVQKGDTQQTFTLSRAAKQTWPVTLDIPKQTDTMKLDLLFLIDATGSMADEIGKIQQTIFDVAASIDHLSGQGQIRYGLVAYRDRGDNFVARNFDFTPDVRQFSANLSSIQADGGGDYPESLNEGLHHALHNATWRSDDTIRLIFLVADAPPHLDYAQDYDYAVEMDEAVQQGIKILPIASSGLDEQGEYIFRQMAQYSQGRFIFLTSATPTGAASGPGNGQQGQGFSVANLDELLVHLVKLELSHQNPHLATGAAAPVTTTIIHTEPDTFTFSGTLTTLNTGWLWLGLVSLLGGGWLIWGWSVWPALSKKARPLTGPRHPLPVNQETLVTPALQHYVTQAARYKRQIDQLSDTPTLSNLQTLPPQIEAWSQAVESLAWRIEFFRQNPLIHQDLETVPRAIEALETQLAKETDSTIRLELKRVLAKRVEQLTLLSGLQHTMRRAELQIEHTLSALGTIYSQLMVGQSTHHMADSRRLLSEIDEEVQRLQDQLEALKEVKLPG